MNAVITPVFRQAGQVDVDAIVALVHSAYRGDSSRRGWTTEADLLDGGRTDHDELEAIVKDPSARMLLACTSASIVGCCVLRREAAVATLGMLAVSPEVQGRGIG